MSQRLTPRLVRAVFGLSALPLLLWPQAGQSLYQSAAAYVQQGDFERAVPLLLEILSASAGDVKAHNLLAIAYSAMGHREQANEEFRKILKIQPGFLPVVKNLAVNELSLGQFEDAGLHFEEVLKTAPRDPVANFGMGEVDYARKRYPEAVAHYQLSGDLYLKDPQATLRFARSCLANQKPDDAAGALERLAPQADARARFEAGLLLARLEKYGPAAREFAAAREKYPDPYEVGYNLTLAYEKGDDHARAITTGEELVAKGYRKPELYNLLSQAYEHAGRTKNAYDALRLATQADPRDESNYVDLMVLCLTHQNYDLSLEISDIAIRLVPQSHRVRLQRGVVMAMKGRFEDAEQEFLTASRLGGEASLPFVALALVRMQMNKLPEAIEVLRRRRQLNREDYLVDWFLGEALSRDGAPPGSPEEREAVGALEDAVRVKPDSSAPRTLLGKFLVKRGELERAAESFEKALKLDPDDTTAAYQLALLYRKKGNAQRAQELFDKVSKAKSEDHDQFTERNLVRLLREGAQ
ncbi:MAG: tetratricopeptide repeat protein [Acidobacteriia bacterium]|nr:tetratricopeptide repeat protein [Terriglobia bacterium]